MNQYAYAPSGRPDPRTLRTSFDRKGTGVGRYGPRPTNRDPGTYLASDQLNHCGNARRPAPAAPRTPRRLTLLVHYHLESASEELACGATCVSRVVPRSDMVVMPRWRPKRDSRLSSCVPESPAGVHARLRPTAVPFHRGRGHTTRVSGLQDGVQACSDSWTKCRRKVTATTCFSLHLQDYGCSTNRENSW